MKKKPMTRPHQSVGFDPSGISTGGFPITQDPQGSAISDPEGYPAAIHGG